LKFNDLAERGGDPKTQNLHASGAIDAVALHLQVIGGSKVWIFRWQETDPLTLRRKQSPAISASRQ
jgi:hypothetical protein